MVRTAVLVSGGGTNLQAIIDAHFFGELQNCDLAAVITSDPEAYAVTRAKNAGIPVYAVEYGLFPNRQVFSGAILDMLRDLDIELVVLAGFMHILDAPVIKHFQNRIINVHPSLIPAFCGDGHFGLRVHKMALDYGVKLSGATTHFVTDEADAGPVILQKAVEIMPDDTPETLQRRIMEEAEWQILPRSISLFCSGKLRVEGRIVHIAED